jgi:glycosyltransferase involved in cell wall biosynthesis
MAAFRARPVRSELSGSLGSFLSVLESDVTKRQRVLISAFACGPNRGSEPGNGWNWTVQAAKHHDVWLLTSNLSDVTLSAADHCAPLGIKLVRHEVPFWPTKWINPLQVDKLYYILWQITVLPVALKLQRQIDFHIVHHVTFNSIEGPGYLWKLGPPFIWGPVGGAQEPPRSLRRYFGRTWWKEVVRIVRKRLVPFSPTVRAAVRNAHTILVANRESEKLLDRCGASRMVRSIDVGYDPELAGRTLKDSQTGELVVLWAGLLIPRKAPMLALDAVARARARGVRLRLLIAGAGPQETEVRYRIQELGLENSVELLGSLSHGEMRDFYARGDVFFFTSLHDTSGTVVLEAMSHELPIVTFDHQGVADMVSVDSGVKVHPGEHAQVLDDFAEAFELLANDPTTRRRYGSVARTRVETRFAWCHKASLLKRVYAMAINCTPNRIESSEGNVQ